MDDSSDAEGGALGLGDDFYDEEEDGARETVASPFLTTANVVLGVNASKDPLHEATVQGNKAVVRALLKAGCNPDGNMDEDNNPPIYDAAKAGYLDIVNLLIASKARVCVTDEEGLRESPLHAAAYAGHVEIVRSLITAARKIKKIEEILGMVNVDDQMAADVALEQHNFRISEFLKSQRTTNNCKFKREANSTNNNKKPNSTTHKQSGNSMDFPSIKKENPRPRPPPPGSPLSQKSTPAASPSLRAARGPPPGSPLSQKSTPAASPSLRAAHGFPIEPQQEHCAVGENPNTQVKDCESNDNIWFDANTVPKHVRRSYSLSTQMQFENNDLGSQSSTGDGSDEDGYEYHKRQASIFENNDFSKKDAFSQDNNKWTPSDSAVRSTSPASAPDNVSSSSSSSSRSTGSIRAISNGNRRVALPNPKKERRQSFWSRLAGKKHNNDEEEHRKFLNWATEVRREQSKCQELLKKQRKADEECTADWEKKKEHLQEWCMKLFEKAFQTQHQRRRNLVQIVYQKLQMTSAILEALLVELQCVVECKSGHKNIVKKYKHFSEVPENFVAECIGKHHAIRGLIDEQERRKHKLEDIEREVERFQLYTVRLSIRERQQTAMRCTLTVLEKVKNKPHKQVKVDVDSDLQMEFSSSLWDFKSHKRDHFNRWLQKIRRLVFQRKADGMASMRQNSNRSISSSNPSSSARLQKKNEVNYDATTTGDGAALEDIKASGQIPTSNQQQYRTEEQDLPPSTSSAADETGGEDDMLDADRIVEFLEAFTDHMFDVLDLSNTGTNIQLQEGTAKHEARRQAFSILVEAVAYPLLHSEGAFEIYLEREAQTNDALYCKHKQYLQSLHPLHLGFDTDFFSEMKWQRSRALDPDDLDLPFPTSNIPEKMYKDSCRAVEQFCQCIGQPPTEALELLMSIVHTIHKEAKEFTSRPLDAEAFFPILVWCFVHCDAANVTSAVKYCEKFTAQTASITRKRYSEISYYMTSMMGAVHWICSMADGSKAKAELKRRQQNIEKRRNKRSDSILRKMSSLMDGHDSDISSGFSFESSPSLPAESAQRTKHNMPNTSRSRTRTDSDSPTKSRQSAEASPNRRRKAPAHLWESPAPSTRDKQRKAETESPANDNGSIRHKSHGINTELSKSDIGVRTTTINKACASKKSSPKRVKKKKSPKSPMLSKKAPHSSSTKKMSIKACSKKQSGKISLSSSKEKSAGNVSPSISAKEVEMKLTLAIQGNDAENFVEALRLVLIQCQAVNKKVNKKIFAAISTRTKAFEQNDGTDGETCVRMKLLVEKLAMIGRNKIQKP